MNMLKGKSGMNLLHRDNSSPSSAHSSSSSRGTFQGLGKSSSAQAVPADEEDNEQTVANNVTDSNEHGERRRDRPSDVNDHLEYASEYGAASATSEGHSTAIHGQHLASPLSKLLHHMPKLGARSTSQKSSSTADNTSSAGPINFEVNPTYALVSQHTLKRAHSDRKGKKSSNETSNKEGRDYWAHYYAELDINNLTAINAQRELDGLDAQTEWENDVKMDEKQQQAQKTYEEHMREHNFGSSVHNRYLTKLVGHGGQLVHCIDVCHIQDQDKTIAITCGNDHKICVWDFDNFSVLKEFQGYHEDTVTFVCCECFDGLNPFFVSASDDHTLIIWDYTTGMPKHRLSYHTDVVWVCKMAVLASFNSCTPVIFSSGRDRTVIAWDAASGEMMRVYSGGHTAGINHIAVKEISQNYTHTSVPGNSDKNEASALMVSGGNDNLVVVWDLHTGQIMEILKGHSKAIAGVALYCPVYNNSIPIATADAHGRVCKNPQSNRLYPIVISASIDKFIYYWDIPSRTIARRIECAHPLRCLSVVECTNGDVPIIVAVEVFGDIKMYNLITGILNRTISTAAAVNSSPWGTQLRAQQEHPQHALGVRGIAVIDIAGKGLLGPSIATCGMFGAIDIYDLSTQDIVVQVSHVHQTELNVCAVYMFPDIADDAAKARSPVGSSSTTDCVVATNSMGNHRKIILWRAGANRMHNLLNGHTDRITAMVFNAPKPHSDERLLLISGSWDQTLVIWDVFDGTLVRRLHGHDFRIRGLSYARSSLDVPGAVSGQYMISGSMVQPQSRSTQTTSPQTPSSKSAAQSSGVPSATVCVWDVVTGQLLHSETPSNHDIVAVLLFAPTHALYPPDSIFATAAVVGIVAFETAKLMAIDFTTGARMMILPNNTDKDIPVAIAVFEHIANKQTYLICGGFASTITIWDLVTGHVLRELVGHTDSVTTITTLQNPQFMAGVPIVVSGGADATVRLWNMDTGDCLQARYGHSARIILVSVFNNINESTAGKKSGGGFKFPSMCSFSVDRSICIYDMSYGCSTLPPRGYVGQCYEADRRANDGKWSRITRLSEYFGDSFWLENSLLIMFSVWYKELSFFVRFKDKIHLCVRSSRADMLGQTLLQYVISYGSIILMKLLLNIWSEQLNRPIRDFADQHWFHLSYFIGVDDMILLAKTYPAEFQEFICSLKLRPAHGSMTPAFYRYYIGENKDVVIGTCTQPRARHLWDYPTTTTAAATPKGGKADEGNETHVVVPSTTRGVVDPILANDPRGQPITVLFLPIVGATDPRMLQVYLMYIVCAYWRSV
jgi:WD40 repeat protein